MGKEKQISSLELEELRKATIGKRLKWIIKKMGLKGKDFANRCGLSYRSLTDYLNDKRTPGANNLRPIAETFNINLHWLITGDGYPFVELVKEPVKGISASEKEREVVVSDKEQDKMQDLQEEIDQAVRAKEKKRGDERDLKKEFEHIVRCVEEALALPEEERYIKLFEMVGKKHGIGFLFHPEFGKERSGRKLETVRDIIEAYYEINDFIEEMKRKLTGG